MDDRTVWCRGLSCSVSAIRVAKPSARLAARSPYSAAQTCAILQTTGFTLPENGEPDPVTKLITDSLEVAGIGQPGKGRYKVESLAASEVRDVTHTGTLVAPDGARHPAYFYIGGEDEVISAVQTRNVTLAVANADPSCKHVVMVGFGRDGDAHSVGKYRPNMTILQVAANRDLQLPWLREDKTDSAFTIISEPEVRLHRQPNGQVRLEVTGLNSFNPALAKLWASWWTRNTTQSPSVQGSSTSSR